MEHGRVTSISWITKTMDAWTHVFQNTAHVFDYNRSPWVQWVEMTASGKIGRAHV